MHVFAYLRDLYRFRSRTHRAVVALSTAEETALRDTYGRIHAPVVVIPNGVDLEQFRPPTPDERASARDTFRLDVDARVAIFVGHEFERKGLAFAIEGLLHAPTVMLLVVGGTAEIIDAGPGTSGIARRSRAGSAGRAALRPAAVLRGIRHVRAAERLRIERARRARGSGQRAAGRRHTRGLRA